MKFVGLSQFSLPKENGGANSNSIRHLGWQHTDYGQRHPDWVNFLSGLKSSQSKKGQLPSGAFENLPSNPSRPDQQVPPHGLNVYAVLAALW